MYNSIKTGHVRDTVQKHHVIDALPLSRNFSDIVNIICWAIPPNSLPIYDYVI